MRASIAAAAGILLAFAGRAAFAQSFDPAQALRDADAAMYPPSFSMTVSITTEKQGREPTKMDLEVLNKKGVGSVMEITAPARSRGTRFLRTDEALWIYSPRSGSRTALRLSSRDSFQGSAFSNNDVSDSTWSNDYGAALEGSEVVDNPDLGRTEAWVVRGAALRRDVAYGSILLYLSKDGGLPLKIEYFAKSGLPLKTMVFSSFAMSAGRRRPGRLEMTDAASGDRSSVVITNLKVRDDLSDSMFNQAWLTR